MSEPSLKQLVESIKDSQSASIKLQTTAGKHVHLDCIYKESIAPNFLVVFPPDTIPEDLDISKTCSLSIHTGNKESLALTAKIAEIASDRSIELTAAKTIDPASLREYFRVDIRTDISISFEPGRTGAKSRSWKLTGQTLDLSGSGVLGLFPEDARSKTNIFIEISLTYPRKKMRCVGHVVRTRRIRRGKFHIALHFDDITQKNRDAIITNCLRQQRKQLRENVQTAG